MPKLTDDIKRFIVQELAMFSTPSEVAQAVKEEFRITVTRQHVHEYNPLAVHKKPVKKEWQTLFNAARKTFLEEISTIAIANRAYRLRMLDRMLHLAVASGNLHLAAQLMEQAAKECGDSFSNRHVLTGKDGRPLIPAPPPLTDEQVDSRLTMLLGKMSDAPAPKG